MLLLVVYSLVGSAMAASGALDDDGDGDCDDTGELPAHRVGEDCDDTERRSTRTRPRCSGI